MPFFLAISGSLRAGSSNTAALEAIALLAPPYVTVRRYDELDLLPAFNPDLESGDLPAPVARLPGRHRLPERRQDDCRWRQPAARR